MPRTLLTGIALAALLSLASVSLACDLNGTWHASGMGASIEIKAIQQGNAFSGVAYVSTGSGQRSTYHFKGTVAGSRVEGSHHEGHSFSGTLTPDCRLKGTFNTRFGHRVPVTLTRG